MACPFCDIVQREEHRWASTHAVSFPDAYPLSPGHSLVVPRRHVTSVFDLDQAERADLWELVHQVRQALREDLTPDAFNVGVNDGAAAGQTVEHAHVHVVPRWLGDTSDPRGGIRWVLSERAPYWSRREGEPGG